MSQQSMSQWTFVHQQSWKTNIKQMIKSAGLTQAEVARKMAEYVADFESVSVSENAFVTPLSRFVNAKGNEIEEKAMFRVFKFFDSDASGDLDQQEFANAMKRFGIPLSQEQLDAFFLRYDNDGGGEVSYDEIIGRVCNSTGAGGFGPTEIATTPWDTM